jgi:DNA-binding response OmpR family regulator
VTKILIVDDEAPIRDLLRLAFQSRGYEVAEADNGKRAMEQYDKFSPSVVLIDLVMPGMEGIETIRHLRKRGPKLRIVALSGGGTMGFTGYLKYAEQLGADMAMSKPVDLKELLARVAQLISEAPPSAASAARAATLQSAARK